MPMYDREREMEMLEEQLAAMTAQRAPVPKKVSPEGDKVKAASTQPTAEGAQTVAVITVAQQ